MGTVLFLTGESRGDSLKMLGKAYEDCFIKMGYDFLLIDFRDGAHAVSALTRALSEQPIEFVVSFMGFGANLEGIDEHGRPQNLWKGIGAPYLSLIGDSPAYFFDLHVATFPSFACLYGFPEHEALRRRLPQIKGYIGSFEAPLLETRSFEGFDFQRKAEGQLVFLKNGNDPTQLWDSWSAVKGRPLRALRELADHLASDLTNPLGNQIDNLVVMYLNDCGFDISTLPKLRLFFIAQLDDYLRRVKSTMMAEALMDFPVQIVGENWDHLDFSSARANYVKNCNYLESNELIGASLGLIDMSPNTGQGPHDRACRAFGSYTLCVTNEQEFFRRLPHFEDFSFRFDRESFQVKIAEVLAHPSKFVDIGIEVAKAFRQIRPSEAAAQHLLDVAAMIRLEQRRERPPSSPDFFVWPPDSLSAPHFVV